MEVTLLAAPSAPLLLLLFILTVVWLEATVSFLHSGRKALLNTYKVWFFRLILIDAVDDSGCASSCYFAIYTFEEQSWLRHRDRQG